MIAGERRGTAGHFMKDIVLVAAAYFVAGRLGLLLAIPPGYATAVWPPSGIALACALLLGNRVWPGILVGSFFVNVGTSFDASTNLAIVRSLAIALGIGGGAAMQAVVGAALWRRFVGFPTALDHEKSVLRLLVVGPGSCVLNATCSVSILCATRIIPPEYFAFSWGTWWVGDAIGVIIFTPLLVLWFAGPPLVGSRRKWIVTGPLAVTFAIAVLVFVFASRMEQSAIEAELDRRAAAMTEDLAHFAESKIEVLHSLEGTFVVSPDVSREDFRTLARRIIGRQSGIRALEWAPRVAAADRAAFEEKVRAEGYADFAIRDLGAGGAIARADSRDVYFPVDYVTPRGGNLAAIGFDLASTPVRREALDRARDAGEAAATAGIRLVQETTAQTGFLIVVPVFAAGRPRETVEERRSAIAGFVVGVFRIGDFVEAALGSQLQDGVLLRVVDPVGETGPATLYPCDERLTGAAANPGTPESLERAEFIEIAGRRWELHFRPTLAYLAARRGWQSWSVLALGLLFTGLFGAFLLATTGRTATVERLIGELKEEVTERWNAQQALAAANRDLETILHVASHDLREPLRSIEGFAGYIRAHELDRLAEKGRDYFARIERGADRMRRLLDDLLLLTRAQEIVRGDVEVDAGEIAREVVARFREPIAEKRAKVRIEPGLPRLRAHRAWVAEAMANLVSNALKFVREGASPEIEIAPYRGVEGEGFVVRDHGPGVSEEQAERIFELFQRGVGRDIEGTGAGLAIVRRIAERHGGAAWVKSRPGGGSQFFATFGDGSGASRRDGSRGEGTEGEG